MKAAEGQLLIFERHFSPGKRCRPPLGWGIMPSACFSAPLPRGLVEAVSAGQHVAMGAAWVDLPQANPAGRTSRERASQYPQRSRPSEQRHNDERRGARRSLRTKPSGGGAEKPSKGGIPKGRHCFAGAKCRSSSPKQPGRRETAKQKSTNGFSCFGLRRSKPKATKPLASWRGTGASCVGLALTVAEGMLAPSRLARGQFFPQRPLCD